jgi:hypothetical protein
MTAYRLETLSTASIVAAVKGGHAWIAESRHVDLAFTATGAGPTTTEGGPGDPTTADLSAAPMVALTNPVFVGA